MREIKFRGISSFKKTFVYGTGILKDPINTWIISSDETKSLASGMEYNVVLPETVSQYTGLKDKNGKEIYEGDILENSKHGMRYISMIGFKYSAFTLVWQNSNTYLLYDTKIEDGVTVQWEIIGNIYQDKELMEGK